LPVWTQNHEELARRFPQVRHVVTEKSGHGIQVEQPELVVDLIREVVERARRAAKTSIAVEKSPGGMP
jgi:pimeloyl-ACP methyl ester carboxylesterase